MSQRVETAIQISQSAMSAAQAVAGTVNELAQQPAAPSQLLAHPRVETFLQSPVPQASITLSPGSFASGGKSTSGAAIQPIQVDGKTGSDDSEIHARFEQLQTGMKEAFDQIQATRSSMHTFDERLSHLSSGLQGVQTHCEEASWCCLLSCVCSYCSEYVIAESR
jgi:hypothetical protein